MRNLRRTEFGITRYSGVHPAWVGIGAGVGAAAVVGLITYYGAKTAGRLAAPLAFGNGILTGGVLGYLAADLYATKRGV